MYELEEGGEFC